MPKIKLECCHVCTCLPDYWSGHHLPHVQIPVYSGMSLKEIKSNIMNELRQGAVMGNSKFAELLSWDMVKPEDEKLADQVTKAAYAAVKRIKPSKKRQHKFFTDLEEVDENNDYCDTVCAFFVFVEID